VTGRTPNTFIVGAGQVATALAGALRLGGVPVLGLWSRTPAKARSAGAIAGVAAFSAAPPDIILESDVLVLAVTDDAVADVAQTLVATGLVTKHHVMLHCSGATSAEVAFADVRSKIGGVGTLHPLRAINAPKDDMRDFRGTVFGVQGDEAGRTQALALVGAMGGEPLLLEGQQMAAYHAAAALASNQLVALLSVSVELMNGVGISDEQALAALVPLVRGTLDNVSDKGLQQGLTGPIRRGDVHTVRRHLEVVSALPAEVGTLYRELGLRTVAVAREGGGDEAALKAIETVLRAPTVALRSASGE